MVATPEGWVDRFEYFNLVNAQIVYPVFESDSVRCPITSIVITNSNKVVIDSFPSDYINNFDESLRTIELNTKTVGNSTYNI